MKFLISSRGILHGVVGYFNMSCCKFTTESASERISPNFPCVLPVIVAIAYGSVLVAARKHDRPEYNNCGVCGIGWRCGARCHDHESRCGSVSVYWVSVHLSGQFITVVT